mgnify:FL=1|jgi:hypothetical protein
MTLSIIGAGFGRTGTLSLKLALDQLGLGPCYHMNEVFARPGHAQAWRDAFRAGHADWDGLLRGYGAAVDWPSACFWRQLAAHYPAARVILTVRDRDAWYQSIASTLFPAQRRPLPPPDDPHYAQLAMPRELILHGTFGQIEDKDHVLAVYDAHNAAVRAAIDPARLLEYDVKDGWAPLCAFLGVPVPDAPFPRSNTQQEFIDRLKQPGV